MYTIIVSPAFSYRHLRDFSHSIFLFRIFLRGLYFILCLQDSIRTYKRKNCLFHRLTLPKYRVFFWFSISITIFFSSKVVGGRLNFIWINLILFFFKIFTALPTVFFADLSVLDKWKAFFFSVSLALDLSDFTHIYYFHMSSLELEICSMYRRQARMCDRMSYVNSVHGGGNSCTQKFVNNQLMNIT